MYRSDFTGQEYSKNAFVDLAVRRVRKYLREIIDVKKTYSLDGEGTVNHGVLLQLLNEAYGGRLTLDKDGSVMCADHLEKYVQNRLDVFLEGKRDDLFEDERLYPLRVLTAYEVKQLANIFGVSGDEPEAAGLIVEGLQKKYTQTKASFLSSFDFLGEFTKNTQKEK